MYIIHKDSVRTSEQRTVCTH